MTKFLHARIGPRDIELLTAIDRFPVTAAQLCRLSQAFELPFRDENNLRRRLRLLSDMKLVQCWPYAIAGDGRSPRYFKLTRDGYRLLYGAKAALPKRRYFQAVSPGHHHHTFCLAELVTHLIVMGHRHGCTIEHFARENSVCLQATGSAQDAGNSAEQSLKTVVFTVYPDCAFVVRRSDGHCFPFCVELDNGTERIRSKQDVESLERKLRAYDAHQAQFTRFDPNRYLVLIVTTRSEVRVQHILSLAADVMQHVGRTIFIGASLASVLAGDPFNDRAFANHRNDCRTLIPMKA